MTPVDLLNVACHDREVLAGAEFGPADQILAGWNWREDAGKDGSTVDDPLVHLAMNLRRTIRLTEDFDLVSMQFGRCIKDQAARVVANIENDVLRMYPLGRMMMVSSHGLVQVGGPGLAEETPLGQSSALLPGLGRRVR
jgi:hypothetical protein